MSLLEYMTSVFAPDDCLVCGREGSLLCSACLSALPPPQSICYGCKKQVATAACPACLRQAGLTALIVACDYRAAAKQLVAALKFAGNQSAARHMAAAMRAVWALPATAVLVHQPATTAHVRERGFDQAALIAKHLARTTGLEQQDVLRRSGQQHQLGAGRAQRLAQLQVALSVVRPARIRGRHIILVDDVLTTGASITAASAALHAAGAQSVTALLFAQAVT